MDFTPPLSFRMNNSNYIISIDEVKDKKMLFSYLMKFYAPFEVILSVWGKVPKANLRKLSKFKISGSKIRHIVFGEFNLKLDKQSLSVISENLCCDSILSQITWGLHKDDMPLALLKDWADLSVDSSKLIKDDKLMSYINGLKSEGIIGFYEIIKD